SFAWHTVTFTAKVQERECGYCGKVFVPKVRRVAGSRVPRWEISDRRTCNNRCASGLAGERMWGRPRQRPEIPENPQCLGLPECLAKDCPAPPKARGLCMTHYSTWRKRQSRSRQEVS